LALSDFSALLARVPSVRLAHLLRPSHCLSLRAHPTWLPPACTCITCNGAQSPPFCETMRARHLDDGCSIVRRRVPARRLVAESRSCAVVCAVLDTLSPARVRVAAAAEQAPAAST
jgi:hypothetical protein